MDGSTEVREIQKRYLKNIRMDLESEQRAPLLALFLSFGTIGERTENRSQNWQGKILLMIAFYTPHKPTPLYATNGVLYF